MTKFACDRLGAGDSPNEAARAAMDELARIQGAGGIIIVDRLGLVGCAFNTERMSRAWITADGQEIAGFEP
jgi:isoaspartyl peptidase/L-asparaginase-like protein (Ntn-hydrolase superfamily)